MRIGIVGSDNRAVEIGRLLTHGGHAVTFGDPRHAQRAEQAASSMGTHAEIPYEQAMKSDLLVLAVPEAEVDRAVTAVGSGAEAVIVDAIADEHSTGTHSGAERIARKLDTDRVVRAVIDETEPGANVEICGDDATSKALFERAMSACGVITTDRGPLANAVQIDPKAA